MGSLLPIPHPEWWTLDSSLSLLALDSLLSVFGLSSCRFSTCGTKFLNVLVLLNSLFLGKPSACPPCARLELSRNGKQVDITRRLAALSKISDSLGSVPLGSAGRSAQKYKYLPVLGALADVHRVVLNLRPSLEPYAPKTAPRSPAAVNLGFSSKDSGTVVVDFVDKPAHFIAQEIEPDFLSFPATPGFDPKPLFDKEALHAYGRPDLCSSEQTPDAPPYVRVNAPRKQRILLYAKLQKAWRLSAPRPQKFPKRFRVGVFSVYKAFGKQRFIIDAKPPNLWEKALCRWTLLLGSIDTSLRFRIPMRYILAFFSDETADYYHNFIVSSQMSERNVFADGLPTAELRKTLLLALLLLGKAVLTRWSLELLRTSIWDVGPGPWATRASWRFTSGPLEAPTLLVSLWMIMPLLKLKNRTSVLWTPVKILAYPASASPGLLLPWIVLLLSASV